MINILNMNMNMKCVYECSSVVCSVAGGSDE